MSDPFPIWITRWCLSQGIEEATAWEFPGKDVWCVVATGRMKGTILQSGQWHRSKKEAYRAAEALRKRVLAEARNRVEDLEGVVFDAGGDDEGTGNRTGEGARDDETGAEGQHEPAFQK